MLRTVVIGAAMLLLLVVIMVSLLWAMQRQLIYLPDTAAVPRASSVIPGARDVTLRTSDGLRLGAWFVPAPDPRATVLVANGNAGDRSLRAPLAAALAGRGLSVLLFDYRGYGGNPGTPTEEGLARDVRAAYRFLTEQADGRIVYFGESLGSGVVTELATEHPPAALVLRSPFVSLVEVGRHHYPFLPVRTLLVDRFPLVEQLSRVDVPTLVVYGTHDTVVPPSQSRAVAEAAPGETTVLELPGVGHNDRALLDGPELIEAVEQLVARVSPRR